ncbi:MAG: hypothetical protein R3C29_15885 [Dehalococcoidia bacterium]
MARTSGGVRPSYAAGDSATSALRGRANGRALERPECRNSLFDAATGAGHGLTVAGAVAGKADGTMIA